MFYVGQKNKLKKKTINSLLETLRRVSSRNEIVSMEERFPVLRFSLFCSCRMSEDQGGGAALQGRRILCESR